MAAHTPRGLAPLAPAHKRARVLVIFDQHSNIHRMPGLQPALGGALGQESFGLPLPGSFEPALRPVLETSAIPPELLYTLMLQQQQQHQQQQALLQSQAFAGEGRARRWRVREPTRPGKRLLKRNGAWRPTAGACGAARPPPRWRSTSSG
jgi:hypothetical protein